MRCQVFGLRVANALWQTNFSRHGKLAIRSLLSFRRRLCHVSLKLRFDLHFWRDLQNDRWLNQYAVLIVVKITCEVVKSTCGIDGEPVTALDIWLRKNLRFLAAEVHSMLISTDFIF